MGKIDWEIKTFLSEVNTLKLQIITIDVKNCAEWSNMHRILG